VNVFPEREVIARFATALARHGLALRAGVPDVEIRRFEESFGVLVPQDMRHFYRTIDGMEDESTEVFFIHLWPLAAIRPVGITEFDHSPSGSRVDGWYVFADALVSSWEYAIRLDREVALAGEVVRLGAGVSVAESFSGFLRKYLDADESLVAAER